MSGGKIIIRPKHQGSKFGGAGNTCLYGATGGKAFVRACVGERFAVRNSGTIAIVEGTGDHACEYMTGGIDVILGNTGINKTNIIFINIFNYMNILNSKTFTCSKRSTCIVRLKNIF